jgi:hypothetical protein
VSEGFNTVTYKGIGTKQSISGLGFSPDFVWMKRRTADDHDLQDSVRGGGKTLMSQSTAAETNLSGSYGINSFDGDGFSLVGNGGRTNESGGSYVAWNWDAGENNPATGHSSVTYIGNNTDNHRISGFGFEPDLVWIKRRDGVAGHQLYDSVRGATERLQSDSNGAESTQSTGLKSFDADGFTLGTLGGSNASSETFVAWAWDAGSGSPVSNTEGSITSTVKANPDYGFSITTYTGNGTNGATVGLGLDTPDLILFKSRNGTNKGWPVFVNAISTDGRKLRLDSTNALDSGTSEWPTVANTATTFRLGSGTFVNENGKDFVAYAWKSVAGYSSIGTYTGNGSSSGPTVTTGFRPGFVMVKNTTNSTFGNWHVFDGTRDVYDFQEDRLEWNTSDAEAVASGFFLGNFTDTGFEITNSSSHINQSGSTFIYMAFKGSYSDYVSDLNTDGTIDSRVKANPDYGFSIVGWAGTDGSSQTVGHGLGATPELFIIKNRTTAGQSWLVYTTAIDGSLDFLTLEDTDAKTNSGANAPTSSVFSVAGNSSNKSGSNHIAYCFNSVAGYSSIGSYSGTDSAGVTVTTGFRPAFVMIKATNIAENWVIIDNTRNPANPANSYLNPNTSSAEGSSSAFDIDFTDTGFVLQGTDDAINGYNGGTGEYIYMAFADTREAAFWKDVSGQGNHWTPNNLDYRDSLPDSPANNFAVLQPTAFVNTGGANSAQSLSEGNLRFTGTSTEGRSTPATIRVASGKYYAEATKTSGSGSVNVDFIVNNARVAGKSTSTTGDIIIVAVDVDAGKYWSGLNGTWDSSGNPATGANPTGTFTANSSFTFGGRVYDTARVGHFNFGQDSTFAGAKPMGAYTDDSELGTFQYAPPAGYLALCTANLPTPTIVDGSEYFNTVLWTGDGTGSRDIGGLLFAPDFTWIKNRTSAINHGLFDTVRGAGERLSSNLTNAETTRSDNLTLFNSDGFRVNSGSVTNQSGSTYASWNWKAGGTAVSNTDGSITSQVSANVDAGFSIATYTGTGANASFGHGLGVAPDMVMVKRRDATNGWIVFHKDLTTGHILVLSSTTSSFFSNQFSPDPSSSVVSILDQPATNASGGTYVAYSFANTDGYLKAGSYTGNGQSGDGAPFVYTGFRPAWVMIKNTAGTNSWCIYDVERDTYNVSDALLQAQDSAAEATYGGLDFTSNGFKIRSNVGALNGSGNTLIYLAFAEHPFKYANAR